MCDQLNCPVITTLKITQIIEKYIDEGQPWLSSTCWKWRQNRTEDRTVRTEQKTEQTEDRTVRIPTLAGMIEFYVAEATCGPNHARMAEHSYYSG